MELSDYLRVVRAYWRGVAVLVLLGIGAAAAVSLTTPKVYQADASGFVSAGSATTTGEASVGDSLAKSRAASYVDLATSRATAQAVIDDLGLTASPAALIGRVSVTQPTDTVLIKISARAGAPVEAQQLADAWVRALSAQVRKVEDPNGTAQQALRLEPVEAASLPTAPISPNLERNLGMGFAAGTLLGLGYAVLRSQLDRKVRRPEDVQRMFGVTVAATIPRSPAMVRKDGGLVPLVVGTERGDDPAHTAEAFLKLRTNLQFMDIDDPPRIIVVTSPLPGDGKSSVSANLAAALSLSDRRVVLIDGDLRRPVVAESFGLVEGAGLTDVLIGRVRFSDVAQGVGSLPNLTVLAAGGTPPNPSELLGSKAMGRLLRGLADRGYTVIVDAPPLLPVTDAAVLTASADGALVVVTAGQTLDSQLGAALGNLDAVQGRTLGVVLNRVAPRATDSGHYGAYYGRAQGNRPAAVAALAPDDLVLPTYAQGHAPETTPVGTPASRPPVDAAATAPTAPGASRQGRGGREPQEKGSAAARSTGARQPLDRRQSKRTRGLGDATPHVDAALVETVTGRSA